MFCFSCHGYHQRPFNQPLLIICRRHSSPDTLFRVPTMSFCVEHLRFLSYQPSSPCPNLQGLPHWPVPGMAPLDLRAASSSVSVRAHSASSLQIAAAAAAAAGRAGVGRLLFVTVNGRLTLALKSFTGRG